MNIICCISDTHGKYRELTLPHADILVHAGDWSKGSSYEEVRDFLIWLAGRPHRYKVFIPGNHETWVEKNPSDFLKLKNEIAPDAYYLNDTGVQIEGLNFWGSPVSPFFLNWAFNRQRGPDIQKHWDMIPHDTDVLITHGPVAHILDEVIGDVYSINGDMIHVGCKNLDQTIRNRLKRLRAHICGHVHGPGGQQKIVDDVIYLNASVVNENYDVKNEPLLLAL